MTIRPARAADAQAIAAIWNPMIRDTAITFTTAEKTEAGLQADIAARDGAFWVAGEGGHVLGFATYAQFRGGPGYARTMEHTVILSPLAHGRGIGRALMTNPRLLLLDEATEGLAPVVRQEIWAAVAELKRSSGLALLVVDKSLAELSRVADHAVILERGRSVWAGPMPALDTQIADQFLGV